MKGKKTQKIMKLLDDKFRDLCTASHAVSRPALAKIGFVRTRGLCAKQPADKSREGAALISAPR